MARITEKKMQNKRFRASEEIIVITLLSATDNLSLNQFAVLAKISRSTIYRHHRSLHEVVPNYEEYLIEKCQTAVKHLQNHSRPNLKVLYFRILILLSVDQLFVKLVLEKGDHSFIEKVVAILKPTILATKKVDDGEMFNVYLKEVSALIEAWCEAGFNKETLPITVGKIIYLTSAANIHLSPLRSFDQKTSL